MAGLVVAYVRFSALLARLCLVVASAAIAFAVFALTASALERLFIGISFAVLNDLPPQLMPWVVFPMMGVLLRRDKHVTVDFLPNLLTGRRRAALDLAVGLVVAVASVVFLAGGSEALGFFIMLNQVSETGLDFPLWWIYAAFPVGFAILLWFSVEKCALALCELAGAESWATLLKGGAR